MNPNPILEGSILGSKWLNPEYLFNQAVIFFSKIGSFISNTTDSLVTIYYIALSFIAVFFAIIIVYSLMRVLEIRKKEHKHLEHEIEEYAHHQLDRDKKTQQGEEVSKNPRWVRTLSYLFSEHTNDWRLAVIEADAMLESLLDQLGFQGETLGDKLKSATQEKFKNLTLAWEAHAIRNRIAHEGTAFELSSHEAKRVIAIYEQIFRQYGFI